MSVALERQAQAERHNARCRCAHKKLCLAKTAVVQVALNAVEVWMVREILSFRAEAQVHEFRQFEGLVYAEVQSNKPRSMESVSSQSAEAVEQWTASWVSCIREQRAWRGNTVCGVASCDIGYRTRHAGEATADLIVV